MSRSIYSARHFNDEAAAYAFVEAILWANGRVCPHCGTVDRSGPLGGKSSRVGLYKCYACRRPFTVKIGTIFEDSHIAMRDWLTAIHLICSSKKGISSNQLHRTLGITLKSAWFMSHRLREAMAPAKMREPMGGLGEIVEADETYIGRKSDRKKQRAGWSHKHTVMTLVERSGHARSFHIKNPMTRKDAREVLFRNVDLGSHLMTDEASYYTTPGKYFWAHDFVTHEKDEFVRGRIHTNTVEGFFSVFKRGMKGVYQHCSEQHLHRYLSEFDFRYSNRVRLGIDDETRTTKALQGVVGKRLTYRTTSGAAV
jgi:transposase-like protein